MATESELQASIETIESMLNANVLSVTRDGHTTQFASTDDARKRLRELKRDLTVAQGNDRPSAFKNVSLNQSGPL